MSRVSSLHWAAIDYSITHGMSRHLTTSSVWCLLQPEALEGLLREVTAAIQELGGKVVPKLNWSAPKVKTSTWMCTPDQRDHCSILLATGLIVSLPCLGIASPVRLLATLPHL